MTRIAVLDDWQNVARSSADWSPVLARAEVEFFHDSFADEDAAAHALSPFDIVLATRERTPFPASLVRRLMNLRMFGMTGARAALIAAVQSGRLIAALDVFHREPLPATHPLARAANTVLTPHLGYSAVEVYAQYYRHTVENVLAFLNGKPIRVLEAPTH
jgi:phosphoglycerate dehydrogenase-like enzyme